MNNEHQPTEADRELAERVRATISYNPETGKLTRLISKQARRLGDTGYLNKRGYQLVNVGSTRLFAHRVAWFLMTGSWPDNEIDHINAIRSDNRWENLRCARHIENIWNKGVSPKNKSGFKGVTIPLCRRTGWNAKITHNGEGIYLGTFATAQEASNAYQAKAIELRGEFHRTIK